MKNHIWFKWNIETLYLVPKVKNGFAILLQSRFFGLFRQKKSLVKHKKLGYY